MAKTPEQSVRVGDDRSALTMPVLSCNLRLQQGGYGVARKLNAVPLGAAEFPAAMRHYPIVFASGDGFPLAVLGLGGGNRFVADGDWTQGAYVPVYVRHYPFVLAELGDGRATVLIDQDPEVLASQGSVPDESGEHFLFIDGVPTDLAREALVSCRLFHENYAETAAFVDALTAHGLLVSCAGADGLPEVALSFSRVDRAKLEALADDIIARWTREGWLFLIELHFASLARFADLIARDDGQSLGRGERPRPHPI